MTEVQCGEIKRVKECTDGGYVIRIDNHRMKISKDGTVVQSNDWNKVKHLADHHPLFAWEMEDNQTVVVYLGWTT
jgi:hypothetical protein